VLLVLLLAACGKPAPEPVQDGSIPAALAEPFQLRINQSAVITSENIKVYFRKVLSDSRCPSDVTCVWAGEARVELVVLQHSEVLGRYDVQAQGVAAVFRNYTLAAEALDPYPESTTPINASEYLVTLIVKKA
jgi:hypothetical protein